MDVNTVTITFTDRFGNQCQLRFHVPATLVNPADPLISRIVAALNAMSNCVGVRIEITAGRSFSNTAGTGAFIAEDKMLLVTHDAEGVAHTFKAPAFKATVLQAANGEQLNLASADVTPLSGAINTFAREEDGGTLSVILEGHRITSPREIKN